MSKYDDFSDEEKLEAAVNFVARDLPIPDVIKAFLIKVGLYELIVEPGVTDATNHSSN